MLGLVATSPQVPAKGSVFHVVHEGRRYSVGSNGISLLDGPSPPTFDAAGEAWADPTESEGIRGHGGARSERGSGFLKFRLADHAGVGVSIERPVLVGRSPACDLVLDDVSVSRVHAALFPGGDRIRVLDLASHNGTRAGPMAVRDTEFFDGVVLSFGKAECVLSKQETAARAGLTSAGMLEVQRQLRAFAQSSAPVVVLGETGVGKDSIAGELHALSGRSGHLVTVNAASLTPALARSELFGHTAGAFTGAEGARMGAFELADRGTLFLDEICDLPLSVQAELLRTLDSGEVIPVGASEPRWVSARVLVASNVALEKAVGAGRLREDLYFRLSVLQVVIPPLRERKEDILALGRLFLSRLGKRTFSEGAEEWLYDQQWPGNIRELRAVLTRAALFSEGPILSVFDLERAGSGLGGYGQGRSVKGHRDIIEEWLRHGQSAAKAAKVLGIHRATVHRHIQRYRDSQGG